MPDLYRFTTDELGTMIYELRQAAKGVVLDETKWYLHQAIVEIRREKERREKTTPKPCSCGEITHSRDPKDAA